MGEQLLANFDRQRELELVSRQDQFATLLHVNPEELRGLKFCNHCGGFDYIWTDYSLTDIDGNFFDEKGEDPHDYRVYLTESACQHCDATGFEGGNWQLTTDEWLTLGLSSKNRF